MARFLSDSSWTFKSDARQCGSKLCGCLQFLDPCTWESETNHYDKFWKKCQFHGGTNPCLLTKDMIPSLNYQLEKAEKQAADLKLQLKYCNQTVPEETIVRDKSPVRKPNGKDIDIEEVPDY